MKKYIVGIDEAGRGPLAGPMAIGILALPKNHKLSLVGIRDSKKLSPLKREEWFQKNECLPQSR
jgi:ribonuclease HII